jgi:hypothetical protein
LSSSSLEASVVQNSSLCYEHVISATAGPIRGTRFGRLARFDYWGRVALRSRGLRPPWRRRPLGLADGEQRCARISADAADAHAVDHAHHGQFDGRGLNFRRQLIEVLERQRFAFGLERAGLLVVAKFSLFEQCAPGVRKDRLDASGWQTGKIAQPPNSRGCGGLQRRTRSARPSDR